MKQHIRIDKTQVFQGALDYSHLLDAPAGKHGFVKVQVQLPERHEPAEHVPVQRMRLPAGEGEVLMPYTTTTNNSGQSHIASGSGHAVWLFFTRHATFYTQQPT